MSSMDAQAKLLEDDSVAKSAGRSLFLTVLSSVKTILGAGILSLSWAYAYSSMWPGLLSTILMCFTSAHSFWMLGHCSGLTERRTYAGIWEAVCNGQLAWLPSVTVLLFCSFSIVGYLIIIGDYVPLGLQGLGLPWTPSRQGAMLLVSMLILPLNLAKDLSPLAYASLLGTFGALYAAIVLVFEAEVYAGPPSDMQPWSLGAGLFVMAPSVTFAFNGHFNVPNLYQDLARRSSMRWGAVTVVAFGICFLITCACGASGYYMFGSQLLLPGRSNVFTAPWLRGRPAIMVAYLATSLSVALGIPFYLQSTVEQLQSLLSAAGVQGHADPDMQRRILSLICIISTQGCSMVLTDLGIINAINGAVCASLLMFVFPSFMYMKLTWSAEGRVWDTLLHRGLPVLSMALGLLVGTTGVVTSLLLASGVDIQ